MASGPRAGRFPARRAGYQVRLAGCQVHLFVRRCLAGSQGQVRYLAGPGRFRLCLPRRLLADRRGDPREGLGALPLGSGLARPGLVPVLATIRSAPRRPAWAQAAGARVPASIRVAVSPVRRVRLRLAPAAVRVPVARVAQERLAGRGLLGLARWAGQGQAVLVTAGPVPAVLVPVAPVLVQAACPPGRLALAVAGLAGRVVLVVQGQARGLVAVVVVQGLVVAVLAAEVRRVRRAQVPAGRLGLVAPAVAAVPARKVRSAAQAADRHAAGSRRSSAVRSSTTCRRRRSAACPYRVATAR